ncbi:hypothetical protein [Maridesulfovibrio hydrothermalis]|uniref:Uncharacterized protein n=1 Tax=Maridesulfovibrio hydrothermalis AM13 = DSM 14728 TaxID=1121451 RepID=L0RFN3_9BACT|nr:hypothetical protein [Maridesulfovibrio hydrothermalis]CCO25032.1 conserved protein of unknown function [Maridesulfovibrio hydrothermalis AM13 = DSM 14728]
MKIVAGVDALDLPVLFRTAKRRIILHAAIYGPFARSEAHCEALAEALSNPVFKQLDIIALQPDKQSGWAELFLQVLRPGVFKENIEQELRESQDFLNDLAVKHPVKVNIHYLQEQPFQPIVIVDDIICFGQYAYADVPAPVGFWAMVEADVGKLLEWAEEGGAPQDATAVELAAYRLVSECARWGKSSFKSA